MKTIASIALFGMVQAHKLDHRLHMRVRDADESNVNLDEDINSLMDKYDNPQKVQGFKPAPSKLD